MEFCYSRPNKLRQWEETDRSLKDMVSSHFAVHTNGEGESTCSNSLRALAYPCVIRARAASPAYQQV